MFTRYFCYKINELSYIELNKEVYDALVNQDSKYQWEVIYSAFKIPWTLIGDKDYVRTTNRNVVF